MIVGPCRDFMWAPIVIGVSSGSSSSPSSRSSSIGVKMSVEGCTSSCFLGKENNMGMGNGGCWSVAGFVSDKMGEFCCIVRVFGKGI